MIVNGKVCDPKHGTKTVLFPSLLLALQFSKLGNGNILTFTKLWHEYKDLACNVPPQHTQDNQMTDFLKWRFNYIPLNKSLSLLMWSNPCWIFAGSWKCVKFFGWFLRVIDKIIILHFIMYHVGINRQALCCIFACSVWNSYSARFQWTFRSGSNIERQQCFLWFVGVLIIFLFLACLSSHLDDEIRVKTGASKVSKGLFSRIHFFTSFTLLRLASCWSHATKGDTVQVMRRHNMCKLLSATWIFFKCDKSAFIPPNKCGNFSWVWSMFIHLHMLIFFPSLMFQHVSFGVSIIFFRVADLVMISNYYNHKSTNTYIRVFFSTHVSMWLYTLLWCDHESHENLFIFIERLVH